MKRVLIIGGGISGLAAAYRLLEASRAGTSLDVRLLDAGSRLGGLIGTDRHDGLVLERGPDSMITDKPWALALARRLGLEGEIIGTQEANRRSFVVRNGKLQPVPEGFQLLAPSRFGPLIRTPIFSLAGKARMAMDLVIPRRSDSADESLGDFVLRRLGREALDRMAQPMIAGIYGADPMKLSLQATLPRFRKMEEEHGSVIRAMMSRARQSPSGATRAALSTNEGGAASNGAENGVSGARYGLFVSFRNGMQTLTDGILAALPPEWLKPASPATALHPDGDGWLAETTEGGVRGEVRADAVIVALPSFRAAELLQPLDPRLGDLLNSIPYAGAGTVTFVWPRNMVAHPLDGFGFVVPAAEGLTILGCTFSNVKWENRAPADSAILRAFVGESALRGRDDAEVARLARADLERIVGVSGEPSLTVVWRADRCMPQYAVGHLDTVAEIEALTRAHPGLALAGNAYRGVGIPDSVHSGEQAADAALAYLTREA